MFVLARESLLFIVFRVRVVGLLVVAIVMIVLMMIDSMDVGGGS